MKITQLIADLQRVLENEGDLRVGIDQEFANIAYNLELYVDKKWNALIIAEKEYQGN